MSTTPWKISALAAAALAVGWAPPASGAVTTLSPATISSDTNTTSFSDGNVTLTPFVGGTPGTFNAPSGAEPRLGMDEPGTNFNAFNDPDTNPNNGNEERLVFAFAPTVGLSQITYDFSRADGPGPDDGVIISGFTSDPGVTFSITNVNLFAVYNAGTVRLNIPGGLFSGTDVAINFDPDASRGQTLDLRVTDTTQAGAQFAIRSISYDAVPEPGMTLLGVFGLLGLLRRRR
ncbi:hypothetical protein [Haloferula helveola]